MENLLEAKNLSKAFGRVQALASVTMDVRKGEILGILGPNGSGKTTLFNVLTGVHIPDSGDILFNGKDISRAPTYKRARMGIGRTYQVPRPFGNMTVLENLLVAASYGSGKNEKGARQGIEDILHMTGLLTSRNVFARTLPLLDRKRLEMARALATEPKLLLLDEVAGGLTESETNQVLNIVKEIKAKGITVVWIEHILMMMEGVDRILALDQGRNLICGDPNLVMTSEEVLECYLGAEESE